MENIVKVSSLCFLNSSFFSSSPKITTNIWVFGGYTFLAESGKKFAFYQLFSVFGAGTNSRRMETTWKIFRIEEEGTLMSVTCNGIETDKSWLRTRPESEGLTAQELEIMIQQSKETEISSEDAEVIITTELAHLIKEKVSAIQKTMTELDKLNETELVALTQAVQDLLLQIKNFYPRSYEKLLDIKLEVRKQYAKLKYPELYLELEKLHRDKEYKVDGNDNIVGFGHRLILEGVFHNYFISKGDDFRRWECGSPFEKKFGESLFFNS